MTLTFACLSLLAFGTHAPAETPVVKPDSRKAVVIPFELLESGHMAIEVKLDGKGPYRIIFDTGAPGVTFSGKAAKEVGLIPQDAKPFLLGAYTAKVKPAIVQVGGFKSAAVVPQVMDHPTVAALATAVGPLEGIAGFDLFSPDKLTIDYHARTITVLPAREPKAHDSEDMARKLLAGAEPQYTAPAALWGFSVSKDKDDGKAGVDVTAVRDGSAAAAAGLKAGDRLLVLGRRWTDSVEDAYRAASFVWAGKVVKLTVHRGDKDIDLTVKARPGL
jgi:hypothetical protein